MNIKTTDRAEYGYMKGILKHLNWQDFPRREYDSEYLDKYRALPTDALTKMGFLRLQVLASVVGEITGMAIYELGFGTGYFLDACRDELADVHGFDVANSLEWADTYPPEECIETDVFCAFDVIEHIEDLDALFECIKSDWLYLSVPWLTAKLSARFDSWRHRRPDEHIWHFNEESMIDFLSSHGYQLRYLGSPEDALRKGEFDDEPNILTVIAKRYD